MSSNAPGKGAVLPLTEEQKRRAEKSVNLAQACAKKAAARFKIDYETLLSVAYEGLIKAARKFDPALAHQGEEGWGPFAVQRIDWWLLKTQCQHGAIRHNQPLQQLPEHAAEIIASKDNGPDLEEAEEVRKWIKRLDPVQQSAVMMVDGHGVMQKDAAKYLGLSRGRVGQILEESHERLRAIARRSLARKANTSKCSIRFRMLWLHNHKLADSWRRKGIKKSAENRTKRAVLSATLGVLLTDEWYAVDHVARTVTGPYRTRALAERRKAKTGWVGGAEYGFPDQPPLNARILKRLSESSCCSYQIAEALSLSVPVARSLTNRLHKAGMVQRCGRCKCRRTGSPGNVWELTEAARGSQRNVPVGVQGKFCAEFRDGGYVMLPAGKLLREQRNAEASGRERAEDPRLEAVGVPTGRASAGQLHEELHEEVLRQARGGEGADRGGHGVS